MRTIIRNSISAVAVVALAVTTATRADAQQRGDRVVRVDTLESGRIVISNPDSPQTAPEGVPTLVEVLRIGSLDDTCDALDRVISLAVDGDGLIYAADWRADEIQVFSPRGECVRTIGRSGEGPGEFGMLAGIVWQPPGYLWAMDAGENRLTVFDPLGTVLATHRLQLGPAASLPWWMRVDADDRLHFWRPDLDRILMYEPGPGLDSLGSFPVPQAPPSVTDTEQVRRGGSTLFVQRSIPYSSPRVRWTVNPDGNVWLASTNEFVLHETTYSGDTLRTVRLDRPPPRLEGQERDSIAAAAGIPARRLPTHKYALENIRTSPDGWVWVETAKGAIQAWEVFDERGYHLGRVASPVPIEKEPHPVFGNGMVTGVTLGEFDVPYIVQLRIVRGG